MCRNVFSGTIIKMKKSIVDVGQAEICVCYRKDSFWLTTSSKFDITNWRRRNAQLRSVNTLICCLTSSSKKKNNNKKKKIKKNKNKGTNQKSPSIDLKNIVLNYLAFLFQIVPLFLYINSFVNIWIKNDACL